MFLGSLIKDRLNGHNGIGLIVFAPVRVAFHAARYEIRDSFFVMFFGQLRLVMTVEAGKTVCTGRMTSSALPIGSVMINGKAVIKVGGQPAISTVATRTLSGKMIRRPGGAMAALTIGGSRSGMIETCRAPGRSVVAG